MLIAPFRLTEPTAERLRNLCREYHVRRLSLFGSAISGTFDSARSDLDFAVSFASLDPFQHADAYFGLLEALEQLFSRDIDLLEEEAIRNPYLRASVEESKQILYEAA